VDPNGVELSGAEIVVQALIDEGVEFVFGYPGGAVLHIYDALFKQERVKHILVRHEQAAAHAADGYARATGKCGVCLVTSGPGATNAVTGIATAYMDSIPMVVISGQVPTPVIGSDAFQEVDTVGITRPCVKHNFLVKDVNKLAETIRKAFYIATTGRPGPVVVDVPKDITDPNIKIPYHYPREIRMRSYHPTERGHLGQIRRAVELMLQAKRPVLYTGGGVVLGEASAQLRELVRLTGFPITSTLMGLGAYPMTDRLFLGMLGMHGTYEANMAMHETDVLIAIGARFDDRVTGKIEHFCPHAKIIHIDVDPSSISKTVRVDVPIVGQVASVLDDMLKLLKERLPASGPDQPVADWWAKIEEWRRMDCLRYDRGSDKIKPQYRGGDPLQGHQWGPLSHLRRGPAPDVRGPVLPLRQAPALDQLRRARHHGLRPAGGHGGTARLPGRPGGLHLRRGQHPHVHPGDGHLPAVQPAHQGGAAQQRLHGHGAPVAGVLLREPLLPLLRGRPAGLREARRELRSRGDAGGEARRAGGCHAARPSA
jgi:acetolactate synthase I/II/III large subunit